ncbi:hypothetical protein [Castellaniella sp.]|uniref:hypothetical protein n=1 Tax=Castellaniella sp. TaxID=1955812 RepID=UPI002AFE7ED2|nr:hypothetical protein [Castellaniella sp.]
MLNEIEASARDLASVLGVSDRVVRDLATRGLAVKTAKGRYKVFASIGLYTEHLRSIASGRGGEDGQLDLTAERARLAKEQADEKAMKNAATRLDMVSSEEVQRGWADIMRRVRSGMLAVTSRVRQRMPELDGAQAEIIDREIRDALMVMADGGDERDDGQGPDGPDAASETAPV